MKNDPRYPGDREMFDAKTGQWVSEPGAVYDNPSTMRRELWRCKNVVASIDCMAVEDARFPEMCRVNRLFWANQGPFRPHAVYGLTVAIDFGSNRPSPRTNIRPYIEGSYREPGYKIAKVVP